MVIFLVYSTSGITSGKKKFVASSKWRPFWKFWNIKHSFNLTSDMKKKHPNLIAIFFHGDDIIYDVTGWAQSFPLYSCLGEVGSGSKLHGQCLVNKCKYLIVFLDYTCQKTISMNNIFRDCRSKVNVTGLLGDLGPIGWLCNWKCKFSCRISSNIANYLKYNYLCDGDGINNVRLRLWIFSDFCSRHIVGVAGDDIMFHILVIQSMWGKIMIAVRL